MSTSAMTVFLRCAGKSASRKVAASRLAVLAVGQPQQAADRRVGLCWMAEGAVPVQGGAGALSVALPAEAADLFEVGDDALGGAVRDVTDRGDVTEAQFRGARDDQQGACVIGEGSPSSGLSLLRGLDRSGALPHSRFPTGWTGSTTTDPTPESAAKHGPVASLPSRDRGGPAGWRGTGRSRPAHATPQPIPAPCPLRAGARRPCGRRCGWRSTRAQ